MSDTTQPYEEGECDHARYLDIKGRLICRNCGAVYNEETLTWETDDD
jgi:hypothetical protein